MLGHFLRDKANNLVVVVHRDRDYMDDASADLFCKKLKNAHLSPFLTVSNDVESYFINAAHLHFANPGIPEARIEELIDDATQETRAESIRAIVNLRIAAEFQRLRGTGSSPDFGKIAVDAERDYVGNPDSHRRGDIVLGRVTAKLQAELKTNPRIFVASPFLKCPCLSEIAAKTWPKPLVRGQLGTDQTSADGVV